MSPGASSSTAGARCARLCVGGARWSSCLRPSGPRGSDWERKAKIVPERALTELAGTRDHQGVVARVEPYRYADAYELASPASRCSSASTRSPIRGTSAPSCRSAEGAGATGVILPAHRSARVTPAVARSSAGAVEHLPVAVVPEPLALPERGQGGRPVGLGRGRGRDAHGRDGPLRGLALVFGAEGKGLRPLVRRACDGVVSIPLAGEIESLNVSVAAAVLLVRGPAAADG